MNTNNKNPECWIKDFVQAHFGNRNSEWEVTGVESVGEGIFMVLEGVDSIWFTLREQKVVKTIYYELWGTTAKPDFNSLPPTPSFGVKLLFFGWESCPLKAFHLTGTSFNFVNFQDKKMLAVVLRAEEVFHEIFTEFRPQIL